MVAVRVGDEQMSPDRPRQRQRQAESPGPGAAIEDHQRAVVGPDLHAGGVAAIAERRGAGRGDRATSAPETDAHPRPPAPTAAAAPASLAGLHPRVVSRYYGPSLGPGQAHRW